MADEEQLPVHHLSDALKRQYHAGLAMLRETIENCPEAEWTSRQHTNAYWQIAYHVLYFTHLYLQIEEAAFVPWSAHQSDVQHEDGIAGPADPQSDLPLLPRPYTRQEALEYLQLCDSLVDDAVDTMDLNSPDSGFSWYPISKLEHQLVNLRHLQHHTAQLADRLRASTGAGTRWVGSRTTTEAAD
ncbi:MAG TPA: DinB family protein [Trueperaceae bacterium]